MQRPQHTGQDATPPGVAFLRALWQPDGVPVPGYVQIWTLHDKTSTYLQDPAAARNFDGHADVYTAVGTTARRHGARQRAKANQIAALAGCWLDLDVEPGKIPTRDDAFALASAHLPPTITVDSGGGLHAWHLFERPWVFASIADREAAMRLAWQWQSLHRTTNGGRLDATHDLARLMRLPGTLNAKDPAAPRPVTWNGEIGPRYPLQPLRDLVASSVPDTPAAAPSGLTGAGARVNLTGPLDQYAAKLDALLANSPEFAAVWTGQRTFPSLSEADLSLCSMAAGAMTDPELAQLIAHHRSNERFDENAQAKGRRTGYLRLTIQRARSRATRDQQLRALDELGRDAA